MITTAIGLQFLLLACVCTSIAGDLADNNVTLNTATSNNTLNINTKQTSVPLNNSSSSYNISARATKQPEEAINNGTAQPSANTTTSTPKPTLPPWEEHPLNIGIMVPHPEEDHCIRAAIELAFEDINKIPRFLEYSGTNMDHNNPIFLREYYKFTPYFSEIGLNISMAIQALHDNYMKGPIKNAIIGTPYKELQYDFIEYSSVLGGTQVSYTDIDEPIEPYYVFYAPTSPSINHQFKAAVALMDYFEWMRFGILYDFSDAKYRKNSGTLRESILLFSQHKEETDVLTEIGIWSEVLDSELNLKMDMLQKNDRRIILSLFGVRGARLVFCQAYLKKMYKPKVVWVLFEKLKEGWAKPLSGVTNDVNCTEDQLLEAAHGHIFITKQTLRRDGVPNISNMTSDQFMAKIKQRAKPNTVCRDDIGYAYDSVWVLAKGYQLLSESVWPRFYYYYNYAFGYMFSGTLRRMNFEGLTGPFQYEGHQSLHKRMGQIGIYKYQKDGHHAYLGTHHTKSGKLDLIPNLVYTMFNSEEIPKDKAVFSYTFADFEKPLWITMWAISFSGIIIALIFLAVTLLYSSEDKSYSIGSPILNCVMIFGAILCYTSVIIYSIDTRLVKEDKIPRVCFSFLCALTIGFTMTFGALFAKTWGLYKTFVTPTSNSNQPQTEIKHVPEWVLLVMVGAFLLIDIVLLISWGFMAPFHTSVQVVYTNENYFADTVKAGQVVRCNCQYFIQLLIGLCCYKGILLLIGIFLAWQLKSTKIQVQNEAKQVAIAIYNVFAVSIIGIICVSVLLNTKLHQALYAIVAICILICTTFTLLLVFVPKIKAILYPELEKPQPSSTMKKEIYLRHSQRQYSRKQSFRTSHTELSSTFSTGTLNTQLSVDSTSNATNQHPALQDTLSGGSVVSYRPAEYLSSIPSSNQSTVFSDMDGPITIQENDPVIDQKMGIKEEETVEPGNEQLPTNNGGHRDSGLGDDSPNLEDILLTLNEKEAKGLADDEENTEVCIGSIAITQDIDKVEEETMSPNLTPKSSDGMLDD